MSNSILSFVPFVNVNLARVLSAFVYARETQTGSDVFALWSSNPGELAGLVSALQSAGTTDTPNAASSNSLLVNADFIR